METELQRRVTAKATAKLTDFVRQAWPLVVPRTLVWHWAMGAICEHLQAVSDRQIENLIINVPPGMGKSTLTAVLWPCWEWTHAPQVQWLFATYDKGLTFRDARYRRELIRSQWYHERWPTVKLIDEGVEYVKNDQHGHMFSTSTGGHTTGWRGDRLILDDPQDPKGAESDIKRESTIEWLTRTWPSRINLGSQHPGRVLIQQRLHEMDATGLYLQMRDWVRLKIPLEFTGVTYTTRIGWRDPRTRSQEIINEEVYPREGAEKLKRQLGPYGAAGQLQQEPAPPEGGMIKRTWLQPYRWESGLIVFDDARARSRSRIDPFGCFRFMTADLAFRREDLEDQTDPDFTVFAVWMVYPTNHGPMLFLLDLKRERFDADEKDADGKNEYERIYLEFASKWKVRMTGMDAEGMGAKIVRDMKRKGYPIREIGKSEDALVYIDRDKYSRVKGSTAFLADKRFFVPEYAPWLSEYIKELTIFPNATHVDQCDVTAFAVAIAEKHTGIAVYDTNKGKDHALPERGTDRCHQDDPQDITGGYFVANPGV